MIGIIDLGSNTVRLSIYRIKNGSLEHYLSQKETIGLASYVDECQNMTEQGIEKAINTLKLFKSKATQLHVRKLYVIATASLRNVKNGIIVKDILEQETELEIDLLSGEAEAMADFYGVKLSTDFEDGFVVDIGGGSTEIVEYAEGSVKHAFAIPIGSLSAYLRHVSRILPKEDELEAIKKEVVYHLNQKQITFGEHKFVYGVGGTIRAARKLHQHFFMEESQNGIPVKNIKKVIESILLTNKDSIIDVIRIIPERIHTIIPGMVILKTIGKYLHADQIVVQSFGVREGYLYQKVLLGNQEGETDHHDEPTAQ